jgi:hypothetical protein
MKKMKIMKNYIKQIVIISVIALILPANLKAGNEQRVAQSGASELLLNPWARSSGLGNANTANVFGVESTFGNIAGAARIKNTEVLFSHTQWLQATGISLYSFGLSQRAGDVGVLSLTLTMMDWGEIIKTSVTEPDGTGATFHPQYAIIGASYSKEFSNSIFGGITIKVVNESIADLKATGIAIDAGIQYITGSEEQIKLGVTLKNWGPTMKMRGDGMAIAAAYDGGASNTYEIRSADYDLPTLVSLGVSYDFNLNEDNKIVAMAAFTENSFLKNNFQGGLEYNFKNYFSIRGGYLYEKDISNDALRSTWFTGWCAGFSVQAPLKKGSDRMFGIDYSYRDTDPFKGVHTIGLRISL